MKRLFDLENPVMRFIVNLFNCMILSVLWALFSVPIFTMGAATTALYATVYHHVRKGEGYLWKTFWTAFRDNFKRSTLSWLPMLAMQLFLGYDVLALRTLIRSGNPLGRLFGVLLVLLFVSVVWAVYLAAYCARFQGSVKEMLRYSFYLMMAHPLRSIAVMIAVLGSAALILVVPGLGAILPAAAIWVSSLWIEQIFQQHLRPEDAERIKEEGGTEP